MWYFEIMVTCSVCRSIERLEIDAALTSLSINETAKRFGVSRSVLQRHSKKCLGIRRNVDTESRRMREVKRKEHEGLLSDALESARKLEALALRKGDQITTWRAQREISKILALQSRQIGSPKPEVTLGKAKIDFRTCHWDNVPIFPPGTDERLVKRFGGLVAGTPEMLEHDKQLPAGPVCRFVIERRDSEIRNPDAFLNLTPRDPSLAYGEALRRSRAGKDEDLGPDAIARADGPDTEEGAA